jgi:hypothetical protein
MAKEIKEEIVPVEMATVIIDPKLTNGGLRTITSIGIKRFVGKVTVPVEEAEDLLRRQSEYAATVQKLNDPSLKLRNQNIDTTRKSYIADPEQFGSHPRFTKLYGMADPFQMSFISEIDKTEWAQERMGLFNY